MKVKSEHGVQEKRRVRAENNCKNRKGKEELVQQLNGKRQEKDACLTARADRSSTRTRTDVECHTTSPRGGGQRCHNRRVQSAVSDLFRSPEILFMILR